MLINAQTKIAALLKHSPNALEAIVTLSPGFKKLRNPVLRKLMAGRTSIAMASKIGGCTPNDFFETLKKYGFETGTMQPDIEEIAKEQKLFPQFIKEVDNDQIVLLDVRKMLAEGNDPLKLIQQTVKELQQGQLLKIINTFEPTPLIKLLQKQGFEYYVDAINNDLIETYFYRISNSSSMDLEAKADEANDWNEILHCYKNNLEEIDVRHLEMPLPMITILETLEQLSAGKALYVHHKRIPVFLLTELKERNFDYRIKQVHANLVYLLIFKKDA